MSFVHLAGIARALMNLVCAAFGHSGRNVDAKMFGELYLWTRFVPTLPRGVLRERLARLLQSGVAMIDVVMACLAESWVYCVLQVSWSRSKQLGE